MTEIEIEQFVHASWKRRAWKRATECIALANTETGATMQTGCAGPCRTNTNESTFEIEKQRNSRESHSEENEKRVYFGQGDKVVDLIGAINHFEEQWKETTATFALDSIVVLHSINILFHRWRRIVQQGAKGSRAKQNSPCHGRNEKDCILISPWPKTMCEIAQRHT